MQGPCFPTAYTAMSACIQCKMSFAANVFGVFQPRYAWNLKQTFTPQKFNMEPEKKSLEKEIPFGHHHFSGSMLNFGGIINGCLNWMIPIFVHEKWLSHQTSH